MRTLVCVSLMLLMFTPDIHAQIGRLKVHDDPIVIGRVERKHPNYYVLYTLGFIEVERERRSYALAFTNERTLYDNGGSDIKVLSFLATQSEFDYFYEFLKDGFDKDQTRSLEVGTSVVETLPLISKFMYIYVYYTDGTVASFKLKKRQLDKLFGEK